MEQMAPECSIALQRIERCKEFLGTIKRRNDGRRIQAVFVTALPSPCGGEGA
jgi:hypothetical protein